VAIISVLGAGYEANIYADNYFDQVHQGKKFDWGEYTGGLWNAAKHGVAIALGSIICVIVASIFTLSVVSWVLLGLIMLAIGGILLVAADIMSFKNNPLGAEIAQLLAELSFATGGAFLGAAGSAAGGASAAEGAAEGTGGVRYRVGNTPKPIEKTYEMALDNQLYIDEVVNKYGINLSGSGQDINIIYNADLVSAGRSRQLTPNLIEIGPSALISEDELANTIAHELNHARSWLKGGLAPEGSAYEAGNTLSDYILGGI